MQSIDSTISRRNSLTFGILHNMMFCCMSQIFGCGRLDKDVLTFFTYPFTLIYSPCGPQKFCYVSQFKVNKEILAYCYFPPSLSTPRKILLAYANRLYRENIKPWRCNPTPLPIPINHPRLPGSTSKVPSSNPPFRPHATQNHIPNSSQTPATRLQPCDRRMTFNPTGMFSPSNNFFQTAS